jgi:hypothetical protein
MGRADIEQSAQVAFRRKKVASRRLARRFLLSHDATDL